VIAGTGSTASPAPWLGKGRDFREKGGVHAEIGCHHLPLLLGLLANPPTHATVVFATNDGILVGWTVAAASTGGRQVGAKTRETFVPACRSHFPLADRSGGWNGVLGFWGGR
jgi:predicted dehydrogenase